MSLYRGWSPLATDPKNLGITIWTLLVIAVAIAGIGYVLVPSLYGIASVVLIGLFLVIGGLCILLIVRGIQMLLSG